MGIYELNLFITHKIEWVDSGDTCLLIFINNWTSLLYSPMHFTLYLMGLVGNF